MRFLRWLFSGRWRRAESAPIREQDAYAHSYGDRSGEVLSVAPMPEPEPEPESEPEVRVDLQPEPDAELEPEPEPELALEPAPAAQIRHRASELTGELLRRAFETRLDARHKTAS